MTRTQEPFFFAKFAELEGRLVRMIRTALRRKDGSSGAPNDAAYVIAQGSAVPSDLPNAGNLAVQANTGLNLSGFSLGFDPAGVTSGGVLRIQSGGTGASTAAGALANLGAASAADLATHEADFGAGGHVTGGNAHDHNGGDGAQIAHGNLSSVGTNTHAQIDTFIASKAAASGLASLNASTKVVEDPANATATPTASKIPIADGSGNLDRGWILGTFISRTIYKTATSGTHTFSNKTKTVRVRGKGPGGGGGGVAGAGSNAAAAGGGGSGGEFDVVLAVSPSDTATYNVPAGGAGGTAGNNPGSAAASDTTFTYGATTYTGAKGNGGATAAAGTAALINAGGTPGTATNGDWNSAGQPGGYGIVMSATVAKSGDGAPGWNGTGGAAGRSAANGAGVNGSGNGAGGSGAREVNNAANVAGGDGSPGIIIVEEFS